MLDIKKTKQEISTKIKNSKNLKLIINSNTYKLAHEDIDFLNRNEMRGVRMLLEVTKPDLQTRLVPILIALEWPIHRYVDVICLRLAEMSQLCPNF